QRGLGRFMTAYGHFRVRRWAVLIGREWAFSCPPVGSFSCPPTDADWQAQLAGQTRLTVSAKDALDAVGAAWRRAIPAARARINDDCEIEIRKTVSNVGRAGLEPATKGLTNRIS
ncbi:MAG: hypothetical protein WCE30_19735, partial [Mycobacterium sp.]